jgi:hypothetical protein
VTPSQVIAVSEVLSKKRAANAALLNLLDRAQSGGYTRLDTE